MYRLPALPCDRITLRHYLYDVVYNPPVIRFVEGGRCRGAFTRNGPAMPHAQAAIRKHQQNPNSRFDNTAKMQYIMARCKL